MIGYVKAINISIAKGKPRKSISTGEFIKNKGLVGDSYFGSKVQLVVLPYEVRKEIDLSTEDGICFERFIETVSIDFNNYFPKTNDTIKIGEMRLKVSKIGKRCFAECKILKDGHKCSLAYKAIYLDIIQSGIIHVNDSVELLRGENDD